MSSIIYDTTNIIDWSSSPDEILKQFNSKTDPGLITFFHGHIVLFQELRLLDKSSSYSKRAGDKVDFQLDDSSNIIVPSHNLIVTKYLVDLRTDHFRKVSLGNFIAHYPECSKLEFSSTRKSMTWNEICFFEKRIYDGNTIRKIEAAESNLESRSETDTVTSQKHYERGIITPKPEEKASDVSLIVPKFGVYTEKIYSDSKLFCKYLANALPKNAKILDLGASEEPWFSCLCADNGLQVFAYDMQRPADLELIKKKGITYITDDVNNLGSYKDILSNLDFIYCRNLSPAQRFWDWYDPNFVKIWKTMADMLNDKGVIYWIQMGNGTNTPDTFFMNHSAKYFHNFFNYLGLDFKIAKYGYMSFKVAKNLKHQWNDYCIQDPDTHGRRDLYKMGDYGSLIKHYALQLQSFYEANNFELNHKIEITGNPICARIARILLLENFHYSDAVITGSSDVTTLRISGDSKPPFTLANEGLYENDYFLIDEDEDKRFTSQFVQMLDKYQLYDLQKKFPGLVKIKKKYFNRFKFWSE